MVFVKAVRSVVFFRSVTALMCFVFDHLLWPACAMADVANRLRHGWQMRGAFAEVNVSMLCSCLRKQCFVAMSR
jgi:hypothetical protein